MVNVSAYLGKYVIIHSVSSQYRRRIFDQKSAKVRADSSRELLKTYKGCNSRVIYDLLKGDETLVHMFEPQRRADNKQWK